MSKPDLMGMAEEERTDLLALLRSLSATQWKSRSLCSDWSVRDVAAHVVSFDELSMPALAGVVLRGGARFARVNAVALRRYDAVGPEGVVELLARNLRPRGLPSRLGGGIALTDGTLHQQDIRRALHLPRTIPAARLVKVLEFALGAPTLPARKNVKGLHVRATDIDWTCGSGKEVTGPAEALLMALAGRPHSLDELSGAGLATLRERVG